MMSTITENNQSKRIEKFVGDKLNPGADSSDVNWTLILKVI